MPSTWTNKNLNVVCASDKNLRVGACACNLRLDFCHGCIIGFNLHCLQLNINHLLENHAGGSKNASAPNFTMNCSTIGLHVASILCSDFIRMNDNVFSFLNLHLDELCVQ
jgi:hypothetical protein